MRLANSEAPVETSITWSLFSIICLASFIGFEISRIIPTEPADRSIPDIIDASISTHPSIVRQEPAPALKIPLSSIMTTAISTASIAVSPRFNKEKPSFEARLMELHIFFALSDDLLIFSLLAPPCNKIP